jgi:hypothetical protein
MNFEMILSPNISAGTGGFNNSRKLNYKAINSDNKNLSPNNLKVKDFECKEDGVQSSPL